jgi:hypothetical protein
MPREAFAWPTCYKCRGPAKQVDWEDSPCRQYRRYTVYCHGEMEKADLPIDLLKRGTTSVLGLGEMFRPNLLEEA